MNKPEFVYVSYIATTPEKLWEALISPEFTRQCPFGVIKLPWRCLAGGQASRGANPPVSGESPFVSAICYLLFHSSLRRE
jgi:hypothetical protein